MKHDIAGYEGLYKIDEYGNVWNKDGLAMSWVIGSRTTHGYATIALTKNKIKKIFRVHRLVACLFIENPEEKDQVNHIDENKLNNHYKNLEWSTNIENSSEYARNNPDIIRSNNALQPVVVNGTTYISVTAAARFISEDSGRGKVDTIRREIRRRHLKDGDIWSMYGEYLIGG